MALTLGTAIGGLGAVGSFFGGRSAAKAQKEHLRRQSQFADMSNATYRQAQPVYMQMLQQLAGRAGLGGTGGGGLTQVGDNRWRVNPSATPRQNFGMGGNYGTYEDQLRLLGAEEDINRLADTRANQIGFRMQQSGINDAARAAALQRSDQDAMNNYSQFRRGLAINAGQEQERRLAMLAGALNPALSQGALGANIEGQQAGIFGNQAAQANAALGGIFQNFGQQRALGNYSNQYGVVPGGGIGAGGFDFSYLDTPTTYNPGGSIAGPALPSGTAIPSASSRPVPIGGGFFLWPNGEITAG